MIALVLGSLMATAGFRTGFEDGRAWLYRADGSRFWSLGVCCLDEGATAADFDPKNPGFSAERIFGDRRSWAPTALNLLRQSGFNSVGGWGDVKALNQIAPSQMMPYTVVLHLGAYNKAPFGDLFSAETERILDKAAKDQIEPIREDPNLIGYFSDNELGWWRESLFTCYAGLEKTTAGNRAWRNFMRKHYRDDFACFRADWTGKGDSFDEIGGDSRLKPGKSGMKAVVGWQTYLTQFYYAKVKRLIRKYDPKRLILGDRYCQFYYLNVAKASRAHLDVVSTNLGAEWTNGDVSRFFLDSLHEVTGKPVMITEFYMAATENRSGNQNSSGGFPVVATQEERARAVRRNLTAYASRPFVVGAHWFQYYDEPTLGRKDGENYNMGLVDIYGRAYDELLAAFRSTDFLSLHASARRSSWATRIPAAPATVRESLRDWDRDRGTLAVRQGPAFADLVLAQDAQNLYVGLYVMDFIDESIYEGGRISPADQPHLDLTVNGQRVQVRFGGKDQSPRLEGNGTVIRWLPGVKSTLILALPKPGVSRVKVNAKLASYGRAHRMSWRADLLDH